MRLIQRLVDKCSLLLYHYFVPAIGYLVVIDEIHGLLLPRSYIEIGANGGITLSRVLPGTEAVFVESAEQPAYDLPHFGEKEIIYDSTRDLSLADLTSVGSVQTMDMALIVAGRGAQSLLTNFMMMRSVCNDRGLIVVAFPSGGLVGDLAGNGGGYLANLKDEIGSLRTELRGLEDMRSIWIVAEGDLVAVVRFGPAPNAPEHLQHGPRRHHLRNGQMGDLKDFVNGPFRTASVAKLRIEAALRMKKEVTRRLDLHRRRENAIFRHLAAGNTQREG